MLEHTGFGNYLQSQAREGALPMGQNSPQNPPLGLYAEQINGSAFTRERSKNLRSWMYRLQPSVVHSPYQAVRHNVFNPECFNPPPLSPMQMRWGATKTNSNCDLIDGLQLFASNGSPQSNSGNAVYLYNIDNIMGNRFFTSSDGELLFVAQQGIVELLTEFGSMTVAPGEIAVIPRGIKFQANPQPNDSASGYLLENYGAPMALPELGPIGANGLANPRDFNHPQAFFYEETGDFEIYTKFQNNLWLTGCKQHPLNVVAWHGNYVPYHYNLRNFNTIGSISFDHPDPSIFTVLTSPGSIPGQANLDFVIFPERWMVAENTFRPPYYHRNFMNEFMGLIYGDYDAKGEGFEPGGVSIHNCMSAHGPDTQSFKKATESEDKPTKQENTLAFMFESQTPFAPSRWAIENPSFQKHYSDCWQGLSSNFIS